MLDTDNLKKSMINSYLQCQIDADNVTDYLVDLYTTSRFFFLFGFMIIFGLFLFNYFSKPASTEVEKVIQQLRGDPKLIELLRDPQGEKGERGPQGEEGERGPQGEKGEKGEKGDPASKQP